MQILPGSSLYRVPRCIYASISHQSSNVDARARYNYVLRLRDLINALTTSKCRATPYAQALSVITVLHGGPPPLVSYLLRGS
ncbi:hypothetical protein C8R48DRAFT_189783 [Suillus tomentosus]|nr:hypothetical protein C8R48DRAFT_189783 [Suillus tomentosus]